MGIVHVCVLCVHIVCDSVRKVCIMYACIVSIVCVMWVYNVGVPCV